MTLSPEERASLPASMQVPQKESRKVVEHTPAGSFADMTDLATRVPLSYREGLNVHGVKRVRSAPPSQQLCLLHNRPPYPLCPPSP
jgi:transcription initiation factor TFIID subunit TAF12